MSRLLKHAGLALMAGGLMLAASAAHATPATLMTAVTAAPAVTATLVERTHVVYRRHYRPYGFYVAPPLYYYAQPSGCGWLRARWRETGSRYWYRRYRDCIEG